MIIIYGLDGDPEVPVPTITTPGSIPPAQAVRDAVDVGKPYWAFATLPFSIANGVTANFSGAPLCGTLEQNNAALAAMLESPPLDKVGPA